MQSGSVTIQASRRRGDGERRSLNILPRNLQRNDQRNALLRRLPAVDEFGASLIIGMLQFESLDLGIGRRAFMRGEANWPHVANRKPVRVEGNPAAPAPCQMFVFDRDDNLHPEDIFPNPDPKRCQSLFVGNRHHGLTLFVKTVSRNWPKSSFPDDHGKYRKAIAPSSTRPLAFVRTSHGFRK